MCYCDGLPSVDTRTKLVILQHPHERTHPFGTARLARLCMPNASVHVPTPGFSGTLERRVEVPPDAAVLFPHPDAVDLAQMPETAWPSTLVVIDGTWSHAKRLYKENAWLRDLRHVRLHPDAPSNYRIRREPKPDYISTIEAIVAALRIVEPENHRVDELLRAFDRLIDQQLAHRSERRVSRFRSARPRERRAVDPRLADPRALVCYAETAPMTPGAPPGSARELLHWVAARVDTGETFEAVLRPAASAPSDEHLRHVGVDRAELERGESLPEARRRFLAFAAEGAPLFSWTPTTIAWGAPVLPATPPHGTLKASYCNVVQRSSGLLEEATTREGLRPAELPCRGRAGRRLSHALALARWLRARLESA